MIILVIGGLFYIIQIQTDMLKQAHQKRSVQQTPNPGERIHILDNISVQTPPPHIPDRQGLYNNGHPSVQQTPNPGEKIHILNNDGQEGKNQPPRSLGIDESGETVVNWNKPLGLADPNIPGEGLSKPSEIKIEHKKKHKIYQMLKSVNRGYRIWNPTTHEDDDPSTVREEMLNSLVEHSMLHERVGKLKIHKLELREVCSDKHAKLKKFEYGKTHFAKSKKKEKVVMLVGATGSGKTTHINSMINYYFGVEYEDNFRFKLITEEDNGKRNQAHSQTSWITAYTILHQKGFKVDYTLTIVDTPGFGATRGINRDNEITKQIRKFFISSGNQGIDHIDVVAFVAQSSLPTLTVTQKYIFEQILALFGKDIGQNIYLMLTFADGKVPQVLTGIQEARLPYQEYFKFNNSIIFDDNQSDDEFCKMFWKMGMLSLEQFFDQFSKITSRSLKQTKQVLHERERIETQVEGLQNEVKRGLSKLVQLRREVQVVLDLENDIARNKDFTYTVNEDTIVKRDLNPGTYVTNCITCNMTCHYSCSIPDDGDMYQCPAMDGGGKNNAKCRVCPKACSWDQHKNMQYYFATKSQSVTKTSDELRQRYQDANGNIHSAQQIVNGLVDEFEAVQIKVFGITEVLRKSITTLNKIALKPTCLSTSEYITILIQSERTAAEPGWEARVNNLMDVKDKVECLIQISEDGYDPFEGFKRKIEEEKQTKQGVWYAVGSYLEKIQFWTC